MASMTVNEIIEKIYEYRDLGISAIPVRSGPWYDSNKNVIGLKCKFPAVSKYQELCERLPEDSEIEKWRWIGNQLINYAKNQEKPNSFKFHNEDEHDLALKGLINFSGLGLMMGEQSDLMAVDVDETNQDIVDDVLKNVQFSPWSRKGGKGEVRFYRRDKDLKSYAEVGKVEFFSNNRMVVVPPSMYSFNFASNDVQYYEWINNGDIDDMPVFDQSTIQRVEMVYDGRNTSFIDQNAPNAIITDREESGRFEPLKKFVSNVIAKRMPPDAAIAQIIEFDKSLSSSALSEPKWRGNFASDVTASAFDLYTSIWRSHQQKKKKDFETPELGFRQEEIQTWVNDPIYDDYVDGAVIDPFDYKAIPKPWRKLALAIADANSLPLESVFVMMLTQLGSILGNKVLIQAKRKNKSWLEAHNIWSIYVSRSGTRKSQLLNTVSKPVYMLQAEHDISYKEAKKAYNNEKDILEPQIASIEKQVKQYAVEQEKSPEIKILQEQLDHLKSKLEPPVRKQLVVKGVTPEKLIEIIDQNDTGTFLVYNELSELLNMFKKKGYESMRTLLLDAWDGVNPMSYQTKHSGEVFIDMACVSIYSSVQPSMLKKDIQDLSNGYGDDGFYQRSFFVFNDNPDMEAIDIEFDHNQFFKEYSIYGKAFYLERTETPVIFDDLAYDEFIEYEERILKMISQEENEAICSFYSKMIGKVVKVASMMEFVKRDGDMHQKVTLASLVDAIYIMDRQIIHVQKMFDQNKKSLLKTCIQEIKEGIIESGQTLYQLERKHSRYFKNDTTRHFIVEELVKRNIGKLVKNKKGYKLLVSPKVI